ncbi:Serine/threonine-protein kinase B [compost metagenome]
MNQLLLKTSELIRQEYHQNNKNSKIRKDFLGANLKGANLRGMNLRGALLIAANLRNADLRKVDFIGADLRDADLSGADLKGCIFLTQAQVNSAKGNKETRLPRYVKLPDHWL